MGSKILDNPAHHSCHAERHRPSSMSLRDTLYDPVDHGLGPFTYKPTRSDPVHPVFTNPSPNSTFSDLTRRLASQENATRSFRRMDQMVERKNRNRKEHKERKSCRRNFFSGLSADPANLLCCNWLSRSDFCHSLEKLRKMTRKAMAFHSPCETSSLSPCNFYQ